ncbi:T9SS type A sorting domain-containing protein [bacterium]|nr:T9SS type A sorting domain-containing protein [bacterium]
MRVLAFVLTLLFLPLMVVAQINWGSAQVAGSGINFASQLCAADFDGDGDMDLAAPDGEPYYNAKIHMYENLGGGDFADHILVTGLVSPRGVNAVDLDQDGDMDLLCTDRAVNGLVFWLENDGTGDFTYHLAGNNLDGGERSCAADFDDDGDLDLASVESGNNSDWDVSWWENDGSQNFTRHLVDEDFWGATHVNTTDLNQDGRVDILATSGYAENWGKVTWYMNMGDGTFERHIVLDQFDRAGNPVAADMNGDGILDLLATSADLNTVAWLEGDGTPEDGGWIEHDLTTTYQQAHGLNVADLDGDGAMDIVTCAWTGDQVSWWQNDGTGVFTEYLIAAFEGPTDVIATDINGDDLLDVVATSTDLDRIAYWEQGGETVPVMLNLTGQNTTVPMNGGLVRYTVTIQNNLDRVFAGTWFWTNVTLPNGNVFGPLMQLPVVIRPYLNASVPGITQYVPGYAPGGTYQLNGYLGFIGNPDLQVTDSFSFIKAGPSPELDQVEFNPDDWAATGTFETVTAAEDGLAIPTEFSVSRAYPNPFNPSTSLTVTLPDAANLRVAVYNVAGQLVATLANGHTGAGSHQLSFNAAHLSSGIYFVHTQVDGAVMGVQKVTLMK